MHGDDENVDNREAEGEVVVLWTRADGVLPGWLGLAISDGHHATMAVRRSKDGASCAGFFVLAADGSGQEFRGVGEEAVKESVEACARRELARLAGRPGAVGASVVPGPAPR